MNDQEHYQDAEGNDVTLEKLVKTEPMWAANVIRHLKSVKSMLIVRLHELLKAAELVDEKESLGLEPGQRLSVQIDLSRRYFRKNNCTVERLIKFRPSHFGEYLDVPRPPDCDMVLICVDTTQHKPVKICGPHQVYRAELAMILENNPGADSITIMPYRNDDKVEIKREEI